MQIRTLLLVAIVALSALAFVSATQHEVLEESDYQNFFTAFVKKYNKKYTHDEFFPRYAIFKANYNKIRHHNQGQHTYSMAVNEFADMTFAEFHSKMTGYKRVDRSVLRSKNAPHLSVTAPAAAIDWRTKNAVTPVKNQQQCGSCWAFSTTGSTEGAHAIKTGKLVSLSEQQLVDCSAAQGNQGCNGGLMDQGFQYIITNKGITTEAAYPYTAADGQCRTNVTAAATLTSFVDVPSGSETALMAAVNIGPVSIAIEADQQCFQFYSGGVLSDPSCGQQLDHGVLLVGYGTDATTKQNYWIVKNSWGASWGEQGYIRLIRGSNECGVAQEASYPVAGAVEEEVAEPESEDAEVAQQTEEVAQEESVAAVAAAEPARPHLKKSIGGIWHSITHWTEDKAKQYVLEHFESWIEHKAWSLTKQLGAKAARAAAERMAVKLLMDGGEAVLEVGRR